MDGVRKLSPLVFLPMALGCAKPPETPYADWLGPAREVRAAQPTGAFIPLRQSALDAERLAADQLHRVSFTPRQRTLLIERLKVPTAKAIEATQGRIVMPLRAQPPFEALPYQKGWRMIGRAIVWRIERAVTTASFTEAVRDTVAATGFGFALTGGGASDAALGYAVIDEARRALAPAIGSIPPSDLRALGTGIEAALRNRPGPGNLVASERLAMLEAVQAIQNAYRDHKLSRFVDELGKDVKPATAHLESLRGRDPRKRAEYFVGFAAESELWAEHFARALRRNARQRIGLDAPELAGPRPWRRLATHFFRSSEPLVSIREHSVCRTRLLALNALLLAESKQNGVAPSSLVGISKDLTTDPYTGLPFPFRPDGTRFMLYSLGPDLKDDGGESAGAEGPDLLLEVETP